MNFVTRGGAALAVPAVTAESSTARILLVDSSRPTLDLLRGYLTAQGHVVVVAGDGPAALASIVDFGPDLILLDVALPGMDGVEVTRQVRARHGGRWIPIILMSSLQSEQDVVRGLDAGADDYLSKPLNMAVIQAKIRAFRRIATLQAQMYEQARALAKLRDEQTYENELAAALIDNIVHREGLKDSLLSWQVLPSARFSGDVVAAARDPRGVLYVLLGDATGHGLAASVSLIPALHTFYGMARKGLPLSLMAREMNRCLREQLPVGRYLATITVAIDERGGRLTYWNGGMPPAYMLGPDGEVRRALAPMHVALGILEDAQFSDQCMELDFAGDEALLLYSDGLIEAANARGEPFGIDRLRSSLMRYAGRDRVEGVMRDLHAHLDAVANHDDASILAVELRRA